MFWDDALLRRVPSLPSGSTEFCKAIFGYILCLQVTGVQLTMSAISHQANAIGCFECSSRNGDNPNCHDSFHPINNSYRWPCTAGKEGYRGVFPAHFCIKIKGRTNSAGDTVIVSDNAEGAALLSSHQEELYVRACSVYDMGNMCGLFQFEDKEWSGCIKTCTLNGCNTATRPSSAFLDVLSSLLRTIVPRAKFLPSAPSWTILAIVSLIFAYCFA